MVRPKGMRPPARVLFTVKGWPEWGQWVERLKAETGHPSTAALVEAALAAYAQRARLPKPPPRWDHGIRQPADPKR